ncbi:MAG: MFS transporter [Firmicutes bacterium]|nr:MFS transporter [Bacillota bacterium]
MRYIREYAAYVKGFSRNAKLFLWSCTLVAMGQSVVGVAYNLYLLEVGLGETHLGSLVFYSSLAGVVFSLPAGRASDRFGRRLSLIVASGVAVAATLVQVLHPRFEVLVPATLIAGAAWTVSAVTGGPLLVESSSEEERAHLFGFESALFMVASMAGSYLGGLLPRLLGVLLGSGPPLVGLRTTLLAGVGLLALSLVPLFPLVEGPRARLPVLTSASAWLSFSDGRLVGKLLVPQALIGLGAGLIVPLQNVFMTRYLGASPAQIGLMFSLSSALTGVGSLVAPGLARRWGKIRAVAVSQLSSLPFLALMGLVPNVRVYVVASLVRSSLMNLANPLVSSFNLEVVPPYERATVNSLINMVWNSGWAVSGWVGGWVMQNVSYTLPYGFTFVLYLMSILLFYRFFRAYDRPREARADAGPRS